MFIRIADNLTISWFFELSALFKDVQVERLDRLLLDTEQIGEVEVHWLLAALLAIHCQTLLDFVITAFFFVIQQIDRYHW